jgi:hypothetical protein
VKKDYSPLSDKELEESRKRLSQQILKLKKRGIVFKPRNKD